MKRASTGVSCFKMSRGNEPIMKNPIQTSSKAFEISATTSIESPAGRARARDCRVATAPNSSAPAAPKRPSLASPGASFRCGMLRSSHGGNGVSNEVSRKLPLRRRRLRGRGRDQERDGVQLLDVPAKRLAAVVRAEKFPRALHARKRVARLHVQQAPPQASLLPDLRDSPVRRGQGCQGKRD